MRRDGLLPVGGIDLLVAGAIRASTKWAKRSDGNGLPFAVIPVGQMARHVPGYEHIVIDTEQTHRRMTFKEAAEGRDLLVIPAEPETNAKDGLIYTLVKLRDISHNHHRVLLTKVPPPPETEGPQFREALVADGIPVFKAEIPLLVAFKKASAEGTTGRGDQVRPQCPAREFVLSRRREGNRRWEAKGKYSGLLSEIKREQQRSPDRASRPAAAEAQAAGRETP